MTGGAVTGRDVARALVALVLFTFVLAWGRVVVESHRTYARGVAASEAGDWQSAVLHQRHAAQWHAPLSKSGAAYDALVAIGDARAAADDAEGALVAYRSARFATMATRHLWTPRAARLPELHAKIGALMAAQAGGDEAAAATYAAQLDAWRARQPHPALRAGVSLSFMVWVVALIGLARRGFDAEGGVDRPAFQRWLVATLAAFGAWMICLRLA